MSEQIACIGKIHVFEDIRRKRIPVGSDCRDYDVIVVPQFGAIRLETPVRGILLKIRAVADIRYFLSRYVDVHLESRQCISGNPAFIAGGYDVDVFISARYVKPSKSGDSGLVEGLILSELREIQRIADIFRQQVGRVYGENVVGI